MKIISLRILFLLIPFVIFSQVSVKLNIPKVAITATNFSTSICNLFFEFSDSSSFKEKPLEIAVFYKSNGELSFKKY